MDDAAPERPPGQGIRPKTLPIAAVPPALVPARMLNELLYCERLMHLEWAQGEFADNHFTVEGRHVHRRADSPGGALPPRPRGDTPPSPADAKDRPYTARTVWLSSEALGLTAKIDVVEGSADGRVVPIEYKRGTIPSVPDQAYLPERAQVCAQALLLREHGYQCDQGEIYFAASRTRVVVPLTQELVAQTRAAIAHARHVAALEAPPPPLEDSPKCFGCSLSGICLPDEITVLRGLRGEPMDPPEQPDEALEGPLTPDPWGLAGEPSPSPPVIPVRKLYPARDDRTPIYLQDPRSRLRLSGDLLVVNGPEVARQVRLMNTSHVVVYGNAQITTQALRALFERDIPVSFLTRGGWFLGRAAGAASNNIGLRIAQYRLADDPDGSLTLARAFIVGKIRNSRTLLRRNHPAPDPVLLGQLKQLARQASMADSLGALLGFEGTAARTYFSAWTGMLKSVDALGTFHFERRNRRPPLDPINALLSFAYSLLTRDLVQAVHHVGLEPLLGFLHQPRFGRPALALDLMEEFRPLVADSVVLGCINNKVVDASDFERTGHACNLGAAARKRVIAAYERRMGQSVRHPWFGYRIGYRRVLEVQARLLGRFIMGEIEHYPAFVTR